MRGRQSPCGRCGPTLERTAPWPRSPSRAPTRPTNPTSTPPIPRPDGGDWRRGPVAHEALDRYLEENPDERPVHTHALDVSEAEIYAENRWEPIFAKMRAAGPGPSRAREPVRPVLVGRDARGDPARRIAARHLLVELGAGRHHHPRSRRRTFRPKRSGWSCRCSSRWTGPSIPASAARSRPAFKPAEMKRMDEEIRRRTGECLDWLARGRGVRLGRTRLDRADDGNAGDPVRLPVGGPAAADSLVRTGRAIPRSAGCGRARSGPPPRRFTRWQPISSCFGRSARKEEPGPDLMSMMIHSPAMNQQSPEEFMGNLVAADRRRQRHHAQHDERP